MTERIDVKEMVRTFLEERRFDGLVSEFCGCSIEELFVCGCENNCEAAYRYAFVKDPQRDCPEYAKCAESAEGCLCEYEQIAGEFYENDLFFTGIKRDCRCRRPYANQEAGALL
jgi:hypothetical protein